jgi:hypothetical protein
MGVSVEFWMTLGVLILCLIRLARFCIANATRINRHAYFLEERKALLMANTIRVEMPDDRTIFFIRELRKDLRTFSLVQIIAILKIVLSKLRSCLPASIRNQNLTQAPDMFQFLFVGHWSRADRIRQTVHLDELVQELVQKDQQTGLGLFKSESETLQVVILVLNRIQIFFKQWGINPYPYPLTLELQQASEG